MNALHATIRLTLLESFFSTSLAVFAQSSPKIIKDADTVILQNQKVQFKFDLRTGKYTVFKQGESRPVLADATFKINEILYTGQDFFSIVAGIQNTTDKIIRVQAIHALTDAALYRDFDLSKDFAMIDGFSGGEPLEYGERAYSPLSRASALKSRNNIFLSFSERGTRHQVVMGGLSYHDFEKFASIAQARRTELDTGADGQSSLLCYLDLPRERMDRSQSGETLALTQGSELRRWENHEFRCTEMATSVRSKESIIIEARNLKREQAYSLGFSWWQGHRHGDHPDIFQSVFVEFIEKGQTRRLPLLENRRLPRFDRFSKEDVEQVELPLPAEAIAAGQFRIVVTKAAMADEVQQELYLSEIWLRDGRYAPQLAAVPSSVAESPRPRRSYTGQLYAADPVGKRVDPGQRYIAPDRFYIDVRGEDPFAALENYAQRVRQAQPIELSTYDFPTVCLWYAADNRYGGNEGDGARNTCLGAVKEARAIAASGFLKYSRAAVRLVPDSYMPNNQEGWWDDEHWQREDTDRDTTENGRYVVPYETTKKWGGAVTEAGVIPLTYFQTAYRSEDYAEAFLGHMLFKNEFWPSHGFTFKKSAVSQSVFCRPLKPHP